MRLFLRKKERLHSKKGFAFLFSDGQYFGCGSLGVRYLFDPPEVCDEWPLQMSASVPKRKFKKANQRNQLKRRIKEAYRQHRIPLFQNLQQQNRKLLVFFMYKPMTAISYKNLERDMLRALQKLNELI